MSIHTSGQQNGHGTSTELDDRTRAALTERMVAFETAPGQFQVVGQNHGDREQDKYTVDVRLGVCDCADYQYRDPEGGCKHLRRVKFATGEVPVPGDVDGVDPELGEATDGEVRQVATDGGIIEAEDDGELVGETDDDGRPDECECSGFHADAGLPCWPCYRDGFEDPANAGGEDTDDGRPEPTRSEPADFGHGESTGVQDL